MASGCSTPATCAPTGAPASASRTCSPTSACAASTGCSSRARRWARRAARTACAARPTSRSELLELARGEPDKLVAVAASGQNLDRLVSCFRAARRSGRQLVIDPYQAYVLMQLAPLSPNIPQFSWEGVRVSSRRTRSSGSRRPASWTLPATMSAEGRVSSDELAARPGPLPHVRAGQLRRHQAASTRSGPSVVLVWSMWSGYWKRDACAMREWASARGVEAHFVHSGGHAWPEDLERLEKAVGADDTIWVHTDAQI